MFGSDVFNCYLTFPQPTLGYYRSVSLNISILISAMEQFWSEVNRNFIVRLVCCKPPGDLWVKIVENGMINIELMKLSLSNALPLAVELPNNSWVPSGVEPGTFQYFNPLGHTLQIVKLCHLIGYLIRNIFME